MTRPIASRTALMELSDDLNLEVSATASRSVRTSVLLDATRTAAAMLTEDRDYERHQAMLNAWDRTVEHAESYLSEWRVLYQQRAMQPAKALLDQLADTGFAWRHVAQMVGVTVPAVQKWRRGDRITGENLGKLARLVGACDFISKHYPTDIAAWFEMPIVESAPVTPIDLWSSGNQPLFFALVTRTMHPENVLDLYEPDWRERYRSDFEVFDADDGYLAIRPKAR